METLSLPRLLGITDSAYERFLRGDVPDSIAERLGTNAVSLQRFVDGVGSHGVAAAMHCTVAAVLELRRQVGREGAIGLLIGLCVTVRSQATRR
jgi:hypothetical protein